MRRPEQTAPASAADETGPNAAQASRAAEIGALRRRIERYRAALDEWAARRDESPEMDRRGKVEQLRLSEAISRNEARLAELEGGAPEKLADGELDMLEPVDLTVWPELWARMNRNVKILADAVLGEMSGRGGDLTEEQYDAFLRRLHGAVTEAYADVEFVSSDPAHGELTVEDVRDMFCDYGDPDRLLRGEREPSDALSTLRSRMRSLSKLRADLERVVSGEIPLKAFDGGRFRALEESIRRREERARQWNEAVAAIAYLSFDG